MQLDSKYVGEPTTDVSARVEIDIRDFLMVLCLQLRTVLRRFGVRGGRNNERAPWATSGRHIKSIHGLVKTSLSARRPGAGRIPGSFVISRHVSSSFYLDLNSRAWTLRSV